MSPATAVQWCKSNALKNYKLESLKTIYSGGLKVSQEVIKYFKKNIPHVSIKEGYGMTEIGGAGVSIQTNDSRNINSVGFVEKNIQLKVINVENGKILGANEEGEICVKSSLVMLGYYNNLEETKKAIDSEGTRRYFKTLLKMFPKYKIFFI